MAHELLAQPKLNPLIHQNVDLYTPAGVEPKTVIDDIHSIHSPNRPAYRRVLRRMLATEEGPTLSARTNQSAVPFAVRIGTTFEGQVRANLGDVSMAAQAAGWAATQLYIRMTDGPQRDLVGFDANPFASVMSFGVNDEHVADWLKAMPDGVLIAPKDMVPSIPNLPVYGSTAIRVRSDGHDLPQMLSKLQAGYSNVYSTNASSEAVAGMVGASSLEAFEDAWYGAASQARPVDGALELLGHEAFAPLHRQ